MDFEPNRKLVAALKTRLNGYGPSFQVAGQNLDGFSVSLNTALVAGSDVIALAAKIHGSCEQHGWVDAADRKWLADLIDEGLRHSIYRKGIWYQPGPDAERQWSDQGWGDVTTARFYRAAFELHSHL